MHGLLVVFASPDHPWRLDLASLAAILAAFATVVLAGFTLVLAKATRVLSTQEGEFRQRQVARLVHGELLLVLGTIATAFEQEEWRV